MKTNKKGQSTLEYSLIVTVVIAALLGINLFMNRGIQGRLKESANDIGQQFDPDRGYSSSWKTSSAGQTNTSESREADSQGNITSVIVSDETVTRSEYETFGNTVTDRLR